MPSRSSELPEISWNVTKPGDVYNARLTNLTGGYTLGIHMTINIYFYLILLGRSIKLITAFYTIEFC